MTPVHTAFEAHSHLLSVEVNAGARGTPGGFHAFATHVRVDVDEALAPWLSQRVAEAKRRGPDVESVADAIGHLVLRGGKRMRPVLLVAAFEACGGQGGTAAVLPAALALELLQAYLLVHDDWMDGDEVRRGGPSVPAMMRQRYAGARAEAMSVLAGDLAAAWARRALLEVELSPERVVRAAGELARVEEEVVQGQVLDVCAAARNAAEVEMVHELKTASYSMRGPVVMGAHLAGAHPSQIESLVAFAAPLGVAFQLRDDLLGVFGDPIATGKPRGSDMRSGKRSAVLIDAFHDPNESGPLSRVLGRADATDEEVGCAVATLEASGAGARVEARIDTLSRIARAALDRASFQPHGRALLAEAVSVFTGGRG
jgi:geranylgeranyl diphosphate synthase type I